MQELDDIALLREYVERDSETAFATLVIRHIDRVYSVALRHTNDPHPAGEITQAVFVILARKAKSLRREVMLEGWLYQTARLTALTHIRSEIRRARREQEAYMQSKVDENESEAWTQIAPLLDAALAGLNETDRHALVLRFFYGKSLREVGAAFGGSEDTARMRVNRALEKLRKYFTKHGVDSTMAVIAGAMSANSVQAAPAVLAKTVTVIALAQGAATGGSTLTLVKGTLKLMTWTKTQTVIVGAVIAGIAAYSVVHHHAQAKLRESESLRQPAAQSLPPVAKNSRDSNLPASTGNSAMNVQKNSASHMATVAPEQGSNTVLAAGSQPASPFIRIDLPKDSWTNAGFATPEATLKTRGWAVLNGDRQQFAQSVALTDGARKMIEDQIVQMASASKDPDAPRLIQEALAEKWGAEEAILMPMMAENQNSSYTSYKILSRQSLSADEMVMEVETDMATAAPKTETLNLQRSETGWKIVIDEAAVQKEMGR
jgi:RNA polymerase sigma factor (sigma-70 family)